MSAEEEAVQIGELPEEDGKALSEPEDVHPEQCHLLDLPWEQVLCSQVLVHLSIPQLFSLRSVSKCCLELVQTHFSLQFHLNTSLLGDKLTTGAFKIITQGSECLKSLTVRSAKSWLTNDVFIPVVSSNPKLTIIDLTGCTSLSGYSLYCIGVNCPNVKQLILRNCVWIGPDNFLSFLCSDRPLALEYLDITGCWNLDDETVSQLVRFSPTLKHLLLANLYGVTDAAVVTIAHYCPDLITLSVQGCWRITDNSIKLLEQYCTKLKCLQVKECRNISESSLMSLRQKKVWIDKRAPPAGDLRRLEYFSNVQPVHLAI